MYVNVYAIQRILFLLFFLADDFGVSQGFGNEDTFDEFLAMNQPPPTFDANFNQNIQPTDQYT